MILFLQSFNSAESCGHYHMNKMQGRELTTDTIQDAFRWVFSEWEAELFLISITGVLSESGILGWQALKIITIVLLPC